MKKCQWIGTVALAVAAITSLAAYPSHVRAAEGSDPALKELYEAAKAEEGITWYSSQVPDNNTAVINAFNEAYPGLKVNVLRLGTGALTTRFASERDAGLVGGDVVTCGDPSFINAGLTSSNWFEPIAQSDLPNLSKVSDTYFKDGMATTGITILGIAYNTPAVSDAASLATWTDALDPKFANKSIVGDPRSLPAYLSWANQMTTMISPNYLEKLRAQNPSYNATAVTVAQQIAAGAYDIGFPISPNPVQALKNKGAPIEFVIPKSPAGQELFSVLSNKTASPNTAKLFFDFLFTEAGQRAFNQDGSTAVIKLSDLGTTIALPSDYVTPDLTLANDAAARAALLAQLGIQ